MSRKNHKAFALPTSPVLMNESADDLDRVRETLNNEIKPRGMVEHLYLLDIAELTLEILRLRRWKMAILNKNFVPALETVFTQLLQQSGYNYGEASATAKDIAHRWFTRTCLQLSRMIAATNWTAARKFRASLS